MLKQSISDGVVCKLLGLLIVLRTCVSGELLGCGGLILKDVFIRQKEHNFDALDGLRALSILLMIAFHAFFLIQYAFEEPQQFVTFAQSIPAWLVWVKRGDLGVDVFFVLSAFLLGTQLFAEKNRQGTINVRWFYARRFFRIYPLYVFILVLFMAAKGWTPHVFGNLLAYNNVINLKQMVIPWSWSLTVEIQFYLLAPWLVYFAANRGVRMWWVALTCLAINLTWMAYFLLSHDVLTQRSVLDVIVDKDKQTILYYLQYLYVVPPARVFAFAAGLSGAWLWVYRRDALVHWCSHHVMQRRMILLLAALLALFVASSDVYLPADSYSGWSKVIYRLNFIGGRVVFSGAMAVLLLMSLLTSDGGGRVNRVLSHPGFYPVARVSYAMYLFHPFMLFLSYFILHGEHKVTAFSMMDLMALYALGSLLSFVVGIGTFYGIERWFISERFSQRVKRYLVNA